MSNDDFNFDDFSLESDDDNAGFFGESNSSGDESDDGFEDFGNSDSYDRKETKKTALVAIICGIVLIFGIFGIVKFINRDKDSNVDDLEQNNNQSIESSNETVNVNSTVNNPNSNQSVNNNNDGWVEIQEYSNITWNEKYVSSTFSITSKKYYLKVVDSDNFEIKAKLIGALAGFTGTYELEVPYSIAVQLPVGEHFVVNVQLGQDTSGKNVIGEISYR